MPQDDGAPQATTSIPKKLPAWRLSLRVVLLAGLAVAAVYWIHQRNTHVFSDDAHIAADMIEVSTKTAGQVVSLPVAQGDILKLGDLIAQIDDRTARLALEELEAQFHALESARERTEAQVAMVDKETGGQLQSVKSKLDAALAGLASASSELRAKDSEWDRAQSLRQRQIISEQQWEAARNLHEQASQQYQRAQAEVASVRASVVEVEASQSQLQMLASELRGLEHDRERITASMDKQKVMIEDLRVTSALPGIVDETFVHGGEYVVPGQRLLLMHDPQAIWVNANIKETEIRNVQPGDAVSIHIDAYPDREFAGKVVRVGHAATSQFSLLPNTNPSGNFTKITQRLPIKISIDQTEGLLKPGMMVEVAIVIRR